MAAPNLTMITEVQTVLRRDFPLFDTTLANPNTTNSLVDGEWLELNTSYQAIRQAGGTGGTQAMVFPVFTERGRYDVQAINKVNLLMLGMYEAETIIADTTSLVLGSALTTQDVTIGGVVRRGLKLDATAAASGVVIVGYVSKLYTPAGVGGKVRFVHFTNQKKF